MSSERGENVHQWRERARRRRAAQAAVAVIARVEDKMNRTRRPRRLFIRPRKRYGPADGPSVVGGRVGDARAVVLSFVPATERESGARDRRKRAGGDRGVLRGPPRTTLNHRRAGQHLPAAVPSEPANRTCLPGCSDLKTRARFCVSSDRKHDHNFRILV